MKIKVINPNTTEAMTQSIKHAALLVAEDGTTIEAVSPRMGPVSIESHYDEALASLGVLDEIRRGEDEGTDSYVIACFGDPGLDAARELTSAPVLGIAEAAFHAASFTGRSFGIVTTLSRTLGRARDLVDAYGFSKLCVSYAACEIPVLALENDPQTCYRKLETESKKVLAESGADSIVLGCAGMAGMCQRLTEALHVPVIDGVEAAVSLAQALVRMKIRTSTTGEFALPPAKPVVGLLQPFTLDGAHS
ncbi:MAG: aspartate/glutamate racemase family protein [Bifidobacterium aquikefiri]|uniref:aspartate/glutamate racemase family protein n=1 Tax=Bifidobacterium aquikefiri TaxID=1653207 RepID=UPI0039E9F241